MANFGQVPFLLLAFAPLLASGCNTSSESNDSCNPGDQDGVVGGTEAVTVLLNVSDTGYAVGGVDSGSMEPNIAVENLSRVSLTLTNVGTKPHGMHIACIPTGLPAGCPAISCFPDNANVPTLAPADSATVMFKT